MRDEHRLAEAGHALEQDVAAGEQPDQDVPDELAWPTMTLPTSASMIWARSANASGARRCGAGRRERLPRERSMRPWVLRGGPRVAPRQWPGSSELK